MLCFLNNLFNNLYLTSAAKNAIYSVLMAYSLIEPQFEERNLTDIPP